MKRAATLGASLAALSALPLHAEPAPALLGRVLGDADGHLRRVRDSFALAPAEAGQLGRNLATVLGSGAGVRAVTFALILVIVGCGLEWLYWTAAAAPLRAVMVATAPSPRRAAVLAGRRLALGGFGLAVFGSSTLAAAVAVPWPPDVAWIAVTMTLVIVMVRAAWLIAGVSTAPHHPSLRPSLLPAGRDRSIVAVGVWVAGLLATAALVPGLVAGPGAAPHLAVALRAALVGMVALTGLGIVAASAPVTRSRLVVEGRWPVPRFPLAFAAAAAIVGLFAIWIAGGGRVAVLLVDAAVVVFLLYGSRRAAGIAWRDGDEDEHEASAGAAGEQSLGLLAILSVVRLAILLVGMVVAFAVIDLPVDALLSGANPAARAVLRLGGAVALLLLAQTCWVAIRTGIDDHLRQLSADDPHAGSAEHTRLLTLLPLLRTTLLIVFSVLFGLSALWTVGIEITPLLAGAGIFGLAIGFGAQTLVRDVISGVFFLVEDVFRIGEYIESGSSTKGTVERITLRTVALRHQNGPIHFVPYGALGTVRNTSRDWVIDKFDLPLPLTVDSERVRKLVKRVGETLQADPAIGPLFREPLKAKLSRIDPGVKVFRCKFTTLPGQQFDLRAAALKGIETALAEAGIPFAEKP